MRQARILTAALLLACTADIAAQPGTARPPAGSAVQAGTQGTLPRLKVHPDRRYLVREDGTPFLYLSDTAWELFHRPTREQVRAYLELRARQNFTAIQAVALAEVDGISEPNAYGDLPLIDKDPARAAVTPGADPGNSQEYDYWDHVDYVVDEANRLGMYVAFLPTWARWLGVNPRDEKVITVENAQPYGEFLGAGMARRESSGSSAAIAAVTASRTCGGRWRKGSRSASRGGRTTNPC